MPISAYANSDHGNAPQGGDTVELGPSELASLRSSRRRSAYCAPSSSLAKARSVDLAAAILLASMNRSARRRNLFTSASVSASMSSARMSWSR